MLRGGRGQVCVCGFSSQPLLSVVASHKAGLSNAQGPTGQGLEFHSCAALDHHLPSLSGGWSVLQEEKPPQQMTGLCFRSS